MKITQRAAAPVLRSTSQKGKGKFPKAGRWQCYCNVCAACFSLPVPAAPAAVAGGGQGAAEPGIDNNDAKASAAYLLLWHTAIYGITPCLFSATYTCVVVEQILALLATVVAESHLWRECRQTCVASL